MITPNVRLVRQIGEGGMASVWLAHHVGLDTQVAVKLMSPALACHQAAVERFTREARSAARIHHPNVVQILDYGVPSEPNGLPYIVMEYLEGTDLETRIHLRGRLSLEETASIVVQTTRALDKAHELRIVHRDIKPENIFLTSDGEEVFVKVLDFGIAKLLGRGDVSVTNTGATLGTPTYMSPEQMLSAKNVDYRCDLWALAVVTYEMLTGRKPFAGETYGAVCLAVNRGKFRPPSRYRRDIPGALDEWFTKALSRDPKKRFRSAREMGEAFLTAMGVQPRISRFGLSSSWRGSLMASYVTRHTGEKGIKRSSRIIPMVAAAALFAGALLAVTFARPWWRNSLNTAAAAPVTANVGGAMKAHPPERVTGPPPVREELAAKAAASATGSGSSAPGAGSGSSATNGTSATAGTPSSAGGSRGGASTSAAPTPPASNPPPPTGRTANKDPNTVIELGPNDAVAKAETVKPRAKVAKKNTKPAGESADGTETSVDQTAEDLGSSIDTSPPPAIHIEPPSSS
ncbi:serine/threonine protein kinase [Pendulispora albinea]|uniref:non-specific serine/threonine protein kinase n=1 Tax=Pendulispora albinea TaxID=2741071 RepID=A0ABZ2LQ56_9BACT